jgi:hypothetical protein
VLGCEHDGEDMSGTFTMQHSHHLPVCTVSWPRNPRERTAELRLPIIVRGLFLKADISEL